MSKQTNNTPTIPYNLTIQDKATAIDSQNLRMVGYCSSRNSLCKKTNQWLCEACKEVHNKLLDVDWKNLSLKNFLSFSAEECWIYFYNQKLWKKPGLNSYTPHLSNISAKTRKLNRLSAEQLTLWEIYYVFHEYLKSLKKKHKDANNILFEDDIDKDPLLNFEFSPVKDFLEYNTKWNKQWNFSLVDSRPKNTTFESCGIEIPDLSKLKVNTHNSSKSINTIPELTIKENRFEKLSDQVAYYLKNFEELVEIQRDEALKDTPENKKVMSEYLWYVKDIEALVESHNQQIDGYVQNIFSEIKNRWINDMNIIYGEDLMKNCVFEIAPKKRLMRAVQKIIISHNWDVSRATDTCRGTIRFESINELQKWILQLMQTLNTYNKQHNNTSPHTKITEIYFEDKFWDFLNFSKKSSGYRDGKFLIKLGDGNVIELMIHLNDMALAKNKGFEEVNGKNMQGLIEELNFSQEEIDLINSIIDVLDSKQTKRGKVFWKTLSHFDAIKPGDKLPADFIYNIYRNLDEYDRNGWKKWDVHPFEQDLKNWDVLTKLQFLEREIYQWWYKLHSDKMFTLAQKLQHEKDEKKVTDRLFKK